MHRFRKKSDAQRTRPTPVPPSALPSIDTILPPASDFRTSLILPSLTRRFTLLRTEHGDPVSLQDMKEHLAQRRRGGETQLTEEEEDLVIEELGKARLGQSLTSADSFALQSEPDLHAAPGAGLSFSSSFSVDPRAKSSGRSSNRRSNNLFGAHVEYLPRSQRSRPSTSPSTSTALSTGHESHKTLGTQISSVMGTHGDVSSSATMEGNLIPRDKTVTDSASFPAVGGSALTIPKASRTYRLSVALEGVLDELEGRTRQQPAYQTAPDEELSTSLSAPPSSTIFPTIYPGDTSVVEYGNGPNTDPLINSSWDVNNAALQAASRSRSLSPPPVAGDPARRLPGYVPGMHRPITPKREIEPVERLTGPASSLGDTSQREISPSPASKGALMHPLKATRPSPAVYTAVAGASATQVEGMPTETDTHFTFATIHAVSRSPRADLPGQDSSRRSENVGNTSSNPDVSYATAQPLATTSVRSGRQDIASLLLEDLRSSSSFDFGNAVEPGKGDIIDRSSLLSTDLRRRLERRLSSPLRSSAGRSTRDGPITDDEPDLNRRGTSQALHSSASSGSSGPALTQLAFSGRLSSSSSSSSIGSSYHSSQENLAIPRFGKSTVFGKNASDVFPKWDKDLANGGVNGITADPQAATLQYDTFSYEKALNVLNISEEDICTIHARLTKLQSAVTPKSGPLSSATSNRRPRRPSTPYSVRSVLSGEDTEPGMATESTVTPSKPVPSAQSLPTSSDPVSRVNVSSKLSRKDALMTAMLEGLPGSPQSRDGESPAPLAVGAALASVPSSDPTGMPDLGPQQGTGSIRLKGSIASNDVSMQPAAPPSLVSFHIPDHSHPAAPRSRYPVNDSQLLLDVERKANAATAALKKSPSLPKLVEKGLMGRKPTKRIDPNQISGPHLLPSITGESPVIPVSPSMTSIPPSEKSGGLFRRFRSVGKSKSPVVTDEDRRPPAKAPNALSSREQPASPQPLSPPMFAGSSNASMHDLQHWRFPSPSLSTPPASGSPQAGFKSLISRLRKPKKDTGPEDPISFIRGDHPVPASLEPTRDPQSDAALSTEAAPVLHKMDVTRISGGAAQHSQESSLMDSDGQAGKTQEDLRKLYEAATDLGLDKAAVSDLLVRSRSTSSRAPDELRSLSLLSPPISSRTVDLSRSASLANSSARLSPYNATKHLSTQKGASLAHSQSSHIAASNEAPSQVIRRTLIYPTQYGGLSAEQFETLRRSVSAHSRADSSGSQISVTKSIRDRAPTPPPTRAAARRLSGGPSPPLPPLPNALSARSRNMLPVTRSSESNRASVSEAHRPVINNGPSEIPASSARQMDEDVRLPQDAGLQVLELSNGQVIWSVVDGLRAGLSDDFDEDDRSSFTSDFSVAPPSRDEAVQLFIRGHERNTSSKGSGVSYVSKRKPALLNGRSRPETKIYFSSSAQISSLIENISRGLESGSFDIVPSDPTSPFFASPSSPRDRKSTHTVESASSAVRESRPQHMSPSMFSVSDEPHADYPHHGTMPSVDSSRWTMEDRLEHVLHTVHGTGDDGTVAS